MQTTPAHHAHRFLWLGVLALAIAGIFAIILVAARTPQLSMFKDLFAVALVVHVDLSVLMWFIAIACMGWALIPVSSAWMGWRTAGFYSIAAATALIAISPIDPHWEVIKSNYVPVLNNLPFLLGLGVLAAGLVVTTLPVVAQILKPQSTNATRGFVHAACTTLLAVIAFALSGYLMPEDVGIEQRLETLFWAGGHILQISYTLLMMAAWIALVELISGKELNRRAVNICYALTTLAAVAHASGFLIFPFDSPEFIGFQTKIMISAAGTGAVLLAVWVLATLSKARRSITRANRAYASTLVCSLVLFAAGAQLGMMISGQNVTIPAHYHGAIVGVTLALMGLAYAMLPRFGYADVGGWRLAFWQPIVYAVGQLMHVGGLAYSGGYGVLRKTPGGAAEMATNVKIALGIMGMGGSLAILGGLLFVVVMVRVWLRRDRAAALV